MLSEAEVKGLKLAVVLREEEEGGYSAKCLELPGCICEGETPEETLASIREAVEGYLEAFRARKTHDWGSVDPLEKGLKELKERHQISINHRKKPLYTGDRIRLEAMR